VASDVEEVIASRQVKKAGSGVVSKEDGSDFASDVEEVGDLGVAVEVRMCWAWAKTWDVEALVGGKRDGLGKCSGQ